MRRQTDPRRLHEDTGDKPGPEIMVAPDSEAPSNPRIAGAARESPSAAEARHSTDLYIRTSWVDAALALSELEKVQCSHIHESSVKFRLSYCTCDCFSANVSRIGRGTRQRGTVALTSGNCAYYQGRAYFIIIGLIITTK